MSQIIAKDALIDSLADGRLSLRIREKEPENINVAYQIAVRLEAYSQTANKGDGDFKNKQGRVRGIETEENTLSAILNAQRKIQEKLDQQEKQLKRLEDNAKIAAEPEVNKQRAYTTELTCYGCNKLGRVKSRCPETRGRGYVSKRPSGQSVNPPEGEKSPEQATRPAKVSRIGKAYFLKLKINGKSHDCLLDTGSEVTLMPARLVEGMTLRPTSRFLFAANGTKIVMQGELDTPVEAGGVKSMAKFLVSDQLDDIILGLDWMIENGCVIDCKTGRVQINGIEMPMTRHLLKACHRIMLRQDITIPPKSVMDLNGLLVYSHVKSRSNSWITTAAEPCRGLHLANTLVSDAGNGEGVFLQAINVAGDPP